MIRFEAGKKSIRLMGSIAALVAAVACGDSPKAPASLAPAEGNNSVITVGGGAADTLGVTVLDANGSPISGVTVQWSIASGTGSLSASTSTSDATGLAMIVFTPGSAGQDVVTAAYSGDVKTDLDVSALPPSGG